MKFIKKITIENILSFYVIICPILDIMSFIFRNTFNTNISISTFLRPIIPIIVFIYIFFKKDSKGKIEIVSVGVIYLVYSILHLCIYNKMKTNCSFGTLLHEAQYIVNYCFMVLNLYVFFNVFNVKNYKKLHNSILISLSIYIISIYVSIITRTSSTTYIEGIGYKGWFESGNSLSSILVIGVFIVMSFILDIQNKKVRFGTFLVLALIGVFLMTLIGTRVGLFGFVLAIICFISADILLRIIKKCKINKKVFWTLISILALLLIVVLITGSVTVQRRKHLKDMEKTIINQENGEISHLTGDLTEIRNKIINNQLEENFMTSEQKQSILDLYRIANKYNISNTNTRIQQLIYNFCLVKNQKNVMLILFGNGYLINTNELVLEMELPSFILNFGIIGFTIYMLPFIGLFVYAFYKMLKNKRNLKINYIMLFLGLGLSFVLSTFSGYTFFNSSSMMIIIVDCILLKIQIEIAEKAEK